jgi:hypothetical protein
MEARQMAEAGMRTIRDQNYTDQLVRKWGKYLEGVKDTYTKKVMAILFENQWHDMRHQINEDTLSTNAGSYTKYIFPVLRRVFPNLIANELVSIQPMTGPVGAVFFFEYKHGKNKGETTAGSNLIQNFDENYSSEKVLYEALATNVSAGDWSTSAGSAICAFTPVRPLDADLGFSVTVEEYDVTNAAVLQTCIDDGAGGFTGDYTAGAINYQTGQITAFKFDTATTAGSTIRVTYWYDSEGSALVGDVDIDINYETIRAGTRKLKARWSSESADDFRAYHGIDAETELTAGISQEVSLEIDREVISEMWTASSGITASFDFTVPAGLSELDHIRAVLTRMSAVSYQIHKQTLRAPANWFVTSPEVSAKLTQLQTHGDYRPIWSGPASTTGPFDGQPVPPSYGPLSSNQGILRLGSLSNKWMGYQDPFFGSNQILLGLRGQSYLDAGYVLAPYIPLQMTPTFLDPEDQSYKRGLRTRYAKKLLRSEWYGRCTITGGL